MLRNDMAANIAVFLAAALVGDTDAGGPDLVVGAALAGTAVASAAQVCGGASGEFRLQGQRRVVERVPG